ncbi:hypothetical protein L2E82_05197 [Cichorium intybus]|uniref:Uncharacterized protein n=1 Tax=Cichorium intybus TaxID=13427 RepID=A0ACB9H7L9_CICIN|nr:hypothetical protein L2E82_05197 [Cichorium intybus]
MKSPPPSTNAQPPYTSPISRSADHIRGKKTFLHSHVDGNRGQVQIKVPNAKDGRESTDIEIDGMQGIPADVLEIFEVKVKEMKSAITSQISEEFDISEVIETVKQHVKDAKLPEIEVVRILWDVLMDAVQWSGKNQQQNGNLALRQAILMVEFWRKMQVDRDVETGRKKKITEKEKDEKRTKNKAKGTKDSQIRQIKTSQFTPNKTCPISAT